ncbi:DEAH-box ATP-dependent RNA helicase prp43 [Ascosphaera atra]|nr:DEAH-box ATP-dependent RNA helicase prp43 [Ascosphaera atra]
MAPNQEEPRTKRQKTADPRDNPYLAHMYEGEDSNGYDGASNVDSPLANWKQHQTTAEMARKAEDAEVNPFNGKPLTKRYMSILKTRRDLPVHAQR